MTHVDYPATAALGKYCGVVITSGAAYQASQDPKPPVQLQGTQCYLGCTNGMQEEKETHCAYERWVKVLGCQDQFWFAT